MRNPVMLAAWVLGAVVALAVIVFVVSNRTSVTVSLSPWPRDLVIPVWLLVLAVFAVGALIGGMFVWARAHTARRVSAQRRKRVRVLEAELASAEGELERLRTGPDRGAAVPAGGVNSGPAGERRAIR